ncbi:hypothetical protein [Methylobacterium marchantiae]|uniref:Uncharacterized protein n=1 Tax=Methylobacterium marchantiae TaxID=600331 RepID=A0ABW3WVW7_9HYPH
MVLIAGGRFMRKPLQPDRPIWPPLPDKPTNVSMEQDDITPGSDGHDLRTTHDISSAEVAERINDSHAS